MGKAKRRGRNRGQRASAPKEKKEADLPVLKGLTSTDVEARRNACMAVASLTDTDKVPVEVITKLLEAGVIDRLIPRVCDAERAVTPQALGALRNLAMSSSVACQGMLKSDVISVIKTALAAVVKAEAFDEIALATMEHSLVLLTTISEKSAMAAARVVGDDSLLLTIVRCLGLDSLPLRSSAAQLLYVLSEDNPAMASKLGAPEVSKTLSAQLGAGDHYFRLYIAGALCNAQLHQPFAAAIAALIEEALTGSAVEALAPVAAAVREAAAHAAQLAAEEAKEDPELPHNEKLERKLMRERAQEHSNAKAVAARKEWHRLVATQRLALEIMTNQCLSPEAELLLEAEEGDGAAAVSGSGAGAGVGGGLVAALIARKVSTKVAAIMVEAARTVVGGTSHPTRVAAEFDKLAGVALSCLTNMAQTVPIAGLPGVATLWREGHALVELAEANPTRGTSLLPLILSLLDSVYRRMAGGSISLACTQPQLNRVALLASHTSAAVREVAVSLLGDLASIKHAPTDYDMKLAQLYALAIMDQDPSVAVAAINVLFELYADEDYDAQFFAAKLLEACETTASDLRRKMHAQGGSWDRDLFISVKEALENLDAFIEYKRSHRG